MEHTYTMPGGQPVTIREMQIGELEQILEQAAKSGDFGAIQVAELRLRRQACLVAFDGVRVGRDVGPGVLLSRMNAKQVSLLDEAIKAIHDVRPSEVSAFLATAAQGGAPSAK